MNQLPQEQERENELAEHKHVLQENVTRMVEVCCDIAVCNANLSQHELKLNL